MIHDVGPTRKDWGFKGLGRGRSLIGPVAARVHATLAQRGCGSASRVGGHGNYFGGHTFHCNESERRVVRTSPGSVVTNQTFFYSDARNDYHRP